MKIKHLKQSQNSLVIKTVVTLHRIKQWYLYYKQPVLIFILHARCLRNSKQSKDEQHKAPKFFTAIG